MNQLEDGAGKKSMGWLLGCLLLMVLIAFVIILAAMAVPHFVKYSSPGKQAEPKTNLGAIFTGQVAYFGEYNTYAGGKNCFDLIGCEFIN